MGKNPTLKQRKKISTLGQNIFTTDAVMSFGEQQRATPPAPVSTHREQIGVMLISATLRQFVSRNWQNFSIRVNNEGHNFRIESRPCKFQLSWIMKYRPSRKRAFMTLITRIA